MGSVDASKESFDPHFPEQTITDSPARTHLLLDLVQQGCQMPTVKVTKNHSPYTTVSRDSYTSMPVMTDIGVSIFRIPLFLYPMIDVRNEGRAPFMKPMAGPWLHCRSQGITPAVTPGNFDQRLANTFKRV